MSFCTTTPKTLFTLFLALFFAAPALAQLTLYTPYTHISVPPGESIDYTLDVINNGGGVRHAAISVSGLPEGWEYSLKSGGWNLSQISVLPRGKQSLTLTLDVPLQVEKGTYRFNVVAAGQASLPLTVEVSEEGTFKTEFTTDQANMEGAANSTFTFNAELRNRTAETQLYSLRANAPRGWNVVFKPNYKQATSVNIEPNSTTNVSIEVDPPDELKAGTYKIPVQAATSSTSAALELEVVITGSYGMELTTPTGLLSTEVTAGDQKRVDLVVKNTGSSELKDIEMRSTAPANWEVSFEPAKIERLEAGQTAQVAAIIKASRKAIAGDYVANLEARTPEVTSKASFRVAVETSMLWGWIGILIILIALGSVYRLFQKYGRR